MDFDLFLIPEKMLWLPFPEIAGCALFSGWRPRFHHGGINRRGIHRIFLQGLEAVPRGFEPGQVDSSGRRSTRTGPPRSAIDARFSLFSVSDRKHLSKSFLK